MEIIITLNAKVNNHVHSTKMSIRDLDDKLGRGGGGGFGLGGDSGNGQSLDASKLDYMKL
jgi:hypothetical protein